MALASARGATIVTWPAAPSASPSARIPGLFTPSSLVTRMEGILSRMTEVGKPQRPLSDRQSPMPDGRPLLCRMDEGRAARTLAPRRVHGARATQNPPGSTFFKGS